MKRTLDRRQFVQAATLAGAALALPKNLFAAEKKMVLVFTKSSGFEHDVVKRVGGKPSIVENVVITLGKKHGFGVNTSKDGRVFDSPDFHQYAENFARPAFSVIRAHGRNLALSHNNLEGRRRLLKERRRILGCEVRDQVAETIYTQ